MRYRVKDWDEHYENYKSRETDRCSFVCVPNKQDGTSLSRVLAEPNGAAIYGIWCLVLGRLSRQAKPRSGWLTDDGTENGAPWDLGEVAFVWRQAPDLVSSAIAVLSSTKVGWIEKYPSSIPEVSDKYPSGTLEGKRIEEKEGNGKKGSSEPPSTAASEPPVMSFPVVGKQSGASEWPLPRKHITELADAFPSLDIEGESRKALAWVRANPSRKKTAGGMPKFLLGWMSRVNDRGGSRSRSEPEVETGFVSPSQEQLEALAQDGAL